MGSYSSEPEIESPVSISNLSPSVFPEAKKKRQRLRELLPAPPEEEEEGEVILYEGRARREETWPRKSGEVMLEGYVEVADGGGEEGSEGFGRTKSLTDEDLVELKGCLDLGFGFSYEEIPELCNTLPALELCYSMSQRFMDEQQQQRSPDRSEEAVEQCAAVSSLPIANWRISEPGDHPEEVKARLKYWAQAVACTVRLCS
ncbi:uncharacterized protein [Elaeis guineensis]|uniref:Uncharacterized protein LOC105038121 n=1 Tax=Elaeis guineensis var. tenera TaxID=51953 RepID=A0A6I9QMX3_ELAGV|nr:uncharacterized protein LOC105038121 [Elaeis guineensis]